jgi:tRNA (guanosine-2'-O-)-methyltransferase
VSRAKLDFPVEAPSDAWALLSPQLTAARTKRMSEVVAQRTNHLRLVIQDIHHPHNVSACLRTADAFGIARIDVVTLHENFKPSTAAKGVDEWLMIKRYKEIAACVSDLKASGFAIAAGYPSADAVPLAELPIDRPIAIVFGNEHDGVHPDWAKAIDYRFTIPMFGMVESLNISVSCAVTLHSLRMRAQAALGDDFTLSLDEQKRVLDLWVCKQTPQSKHQLERLRK